MQLLLASVLLSVVSLSTQHGIYVVEIPNGNALPNPCTPHALPGTNGSGHWNLGGGGARNPFGEVSLSASVTWPDQLGYLPLDMQNI